MLRRLFSHPTAKKLYVYRKGRQFNPGAMSEVYQPLNENPLVSFVGTGFIAGVLKTEQPPQLYFLPQVGVVGLGGLAAGQFVTAPLFDPSE